MNRTVSGSKRDDIIKVVQDMILYGRQELVDKAVLENDSEMLGVLTSVFLSMLAQRIPVKTCSPS